MKEENTEPIWKVQLNIYNWVQEKSKQWYYCSLSCCGYNQLVCPYGVDTCLHCSLHCLGVMSDVVKEVCI